MTKFNKRTILSKEIKGTTELIAGQLGTKLFNTTIRSSVAIMEAQTTQQEIFSYAPNNTAVQDYKDFVDELIERGL